jgi:hypothetical protein
MRIDSIDLFGPLYVNSTIGSEGQILAFSGSQISWISASGSGTGTIGPQGPTGSGLIIPNGQILFGQNVGLTSSSCFRVDIREGGGFGTFVQGIEITTVGNEENILASCKSCTTYSGLRSTIISTCDSFLCRSNGSTIIGGAKHYMGYACNHYSSTILGGYCNISPGGMKYSVIAGGNNNNMWYDNAYHAQYSTILGGCGNVICPGGVNIGNNSYNLITGGILNNIYGGCLVGIFGGCNNRTVYNSSQGVKNSVIIGGFLGQFCFEIGNPTQIKYSAIIGAKDSGYQNVKMYRSYSVILGGEDVQSGPYFANGFFDCSTFARCVTVCELLKLRNYTPTIDFNSSLYSADNVLSVQEKAGGGNSYFYHNVQGVGKNKFNICFN